jgi:hypothetical protein
MRSVANRVAKFPLTWVAIVFAIAQLADLVTAWNVTRELNPIAAALASMPLAGVVVKIGLIAFVIAVARICDRRRPVLARCLLAFGALAGLAGAITNTHLTPFVS